MKKLHLFLLLAPIFFSSCGIPTKKDFTSYNHKGIKSLFIVNPTEEDKPKDDIWVELSAKSRNVSDDENPIDSEEAYEKSLASNEENDLFPLRSPTFKFPEALKNTSRAADEFVKEKTVFYKKGQMKKIAIGIESPSEEIFQCVYDEGKYCYVWTRKNEPKISKVSDDEIKNIADKFDRIYEKLTVLCGNKYDGKSKVPDICSPNDKISILLYDIDNDTSKSTYWGFFSRSDMFNNGENMMEAIHVDSYSAKQEKNKNYIFSTIAHELTHKLNFDNKYLKYGLNFDTSDRLKTRNILILFHKGKLFNYLVCSLC